MDLKSKKIIRFDYVSNMFATVCVIAFVMAIASAAMAMFGAFAIFLGVVVFCVLGIWWRLKTIKQQIIAWKSTITKGTISDIYNESGNLRVHIDYVVDGVPQTKRWLLLGGILLRKKLSAMKEVQVIYNKDKPRQAHVINFYQ